MLLKQQDWQIIPQLQGTKNKHNRRCINITWMLICWRKKERGTLEKHIPHMHALFEGSKVKCQLCYATKWYHPKWIPGCHCWNWSHLIYHNFALTTNLAAAFDRLMYEAGSPAQGITAVTCGENWGELLLFAYARISDATGRGTSA